MVDGYRDNRSRQLSQANPIATVKEVTVNRGLQCLHGIFEFEPLLTREESANHLRISPDAVYELTRLRRNGDRVLASYRIGRVLRFRLS